MLAYIRNETSFLDLSLLRLDIITINKYNDGSRNDSITDQSLSRNLVKQYISDLIINLKQKKKLSLTASACRWKFVSDCSKSSPLANWAESGFIHLSEFIVTHLLSHLCETRQPRHCKSPMSSEYRENLKLIDITEMKKLLWKMFWNI